MTVQIQDLRRADLEAARAVLVAACTLDPAAQVAEEKLFGPSPPPLVTAALGAWDDDRLVGVAAWAGPWLRLLAVHPAARRAGVGSALLDEIIARASAAGVPRLRTGGNPGNYLAPGIDERNDGMLEFVERRRFRWVGASENLGVPLVGNPLATAARADELGRTVASAGYTLQRVGADTSAAAIAFARQHFAAAWAFELEQAVLARDAGAHTAGVHFATSSAGEIAAFAAHGGNNRGLGWFGPAGTLPAHRGKGLGAALLLRCLRDIAAAGHERAIIAWIGPREFYERTAGATSDRTFVIMERSLTP